MEDMDKKEIKEVIEWCDEKGHSEHEILNRLQGCRKGGGLAKAAQTVKPIIYHKARERKRATDAKNKKRVRPSEIPKSVYK